MRWLRILALSGVALVLCVFLTACGGSSTPPPPPPVDNAPVVTSSQLPIGAVNIPYGASLQASGGTSPYTWTLLSGSLPPGLTLNSQQGSVSGTPTTFGKYSFLAEVTDAKNLSGIGTITVHIEGAIVIDCVTCSSGTANLPYGTIGRFYSATLTASGGQAPYNWCVVEASGTCDNGAGILPPGLALNTDSQGDGIISGIPTTPGPPVAFTVEATDSESIPSSGTMDLTMTVMSIGAKSLPTATINTPFTTSITAVGGQANYTWCVLESSGVCDNGAGTLPPGLFLSTNSCVSAKNPVCSITGTPTQIGVYPFTMRVSDGGTPPAQATASFTLDVQGPLLQLTTTSLPAGTVNLPYNGVLQATGGVLPLNWSLIAGTLPAGLTLDPTTCQNTSVACQIVGTPSGPAGKSVIQVQVQDSEPPPLQQTVQSPPIGSLNPLSITINPAMSNATLTGDYAFSFNGYQNGTPVIMAGAFVADGNGNLVKGFLDLNNGAGETIDSNGNVIPQTLTTGSLYTVNPNGTGAMTIVTNLATYKFAIALSPASCTPSVSPASCGRLIQSDPANPLDYGSGVIKVQNGQQFSVKPGSYAVLFTGTDAQSNRFAGAGAFSVNNLTMDCSTWNLPNGCPADIDDAGAASSITFLGNFSSSIDQSTGRGSFVDLTFNGDPNDVFTYAFYVVAQNQMIFISADPIAKPANLTLWTVTHQNLTQTGWGLTSIQGPAVMELNAVDPNNGTPLADITAGIFNAGGNGNATLNSDQNDGGTLSLQQSSTGTYAIDTSGAKTGRVTLTGFSAQFGATPPVLYLDGPNAGYLVGTDPQVTSGLMEIQSGSPYNNASVDGNYAGGSIWPAISGVTNSVTSLFANGIGNITGTQYVSGPGGQGGPNALTLTYGNVDSTGRSVVMQGANQYGILYVVSPTKLVLLPVGTDPVLNVFSSGATN